MHFFCRVGYPLHMMSELCNAKIILYDIACHLHKSIQVIYFAVITSCMTLNGSFENINAVLLHMS